MSLHAALMWADAGFPVFPAYKKRPLLSGWQREATTDADRIAAWWAEKPWAWVAAPTGQRSGYVVLDVDRKAGFENLKQLTYFVEETLGPLPETLTVATRNGGWHFWYRLPEDVRIKGEQGAFGLTGFDLRAEGNLAVLPGSPGYSVLDVPTDGPTMVPNWIVECSKPKLDNDVERTEPVRPYVGAGCGTPLGLETLKYALLDVERAPAGTGNEVLFQTATAVFDVAASGVLVRAYVRDQLRAAAQYRASLRAETKAEQDERETEIDRTLKSAWTTVFGTADGFDTEVVA